MFFEIVQFEFFRNCNQQVKIYISFIFTLDAHYGLHMTSFEVMNNCENENLSTILGKIFGTKQRNPVECGYRVWIHSETRT